MIRIEVVISGRSYDAAAGAPAELELSDGATVGDALAELQRRLPDDSRLPTSCLVAVSGAHLGTLSRFADRPLNDGDELVLVAPVAGG